MTEVRSNETLTSFSFREMKSRAKSGDRTECAGGRAGDYASIIAVSIKIFRDLKLSCAALLEAGALRSVPRRRWSVILAQKGATGEVIAPVRSEIKELKVNLGDYVNAVTGIKQKQPSLIYACAANIAPILTGFD
jgi:hypothetical protein